MLISLVYWLNYLDIFIYLLTVFCLVLLMILITRILSPRNFDFEKLSVYECGFESIVTTRIKFNISFVTIAVLYLIFDLEIILLFPWIFYYQYATAFTFGIICLFFFIILLGFVYEWKCGALSWRKSQK
jgi:NADH-quinone oxidoreductase subunit A